jgi:peroxiredoxin
MNRSAAISTPAALDEAREHYRTRVIPAAKLAVMDAATRALICSGQEASVLGRGRPAPDFLLRDALGCPVRLADCWRGAVTVVVFYRGGWCPYCHIHLRGFQQILPEFAAVGCRLLAVSPQLPDHSLGTAEKAALEFPVLSDVGNHAARAFGLAFRLPPDLLALYREFGHDLAVINGPDGAEELPIPGVFVIGRDGLILGSWGGADYTSRVDPAVVLDLVRRQSR